MAEKIMSLIGREASRWTKLQNMLPTSSPAALAAASWEQSWATRASYNRDSKAGWAASSAHWAGNNNSSSNSNNSRIRHGGEQAQEPRQTASAALKAKVLESSQRGTSVAILFETCKGILSEKEQIYKFALANRSIATHLLRFCTLLCARGGEKT
jgi:hypothetical protein